MWLIDIDMCGPEGSAAGAKRTDGDDSREGERSETVVPEATHKTYKMPMIRQTIKMGTI